MKKGNTCDHKTYTIMLSFHNIIIGNISCGNVRTFLKHKKIWLGIWLNYVDMMVDVYLREFVATQGMSLLGVLICKCWWCYKLRKSCLQLSTCYICYELTQPYIFFYDNYDTDYIQVLLVIILQAFLDLWLLYHHFTTFLNCL